MTNNLTTWHITFGTYGTHLHGSERPTVDRQHNQLGAPFLPPDPHREAMSRARLRFPTIVLTPAQRSLIEESLAAICVRGGWALRACAAQPDHVHVVVDIPSDVHGEKVRRLIKRWLGQTLSRRWPLPDGAAWWAEEGSNRAIHDEAYLLHAIRYVEAQCLSRH
jgi:REP element-mobilizing transposase RayT